MASILVKKDELDLIRSIFTADELTFSNPVVINEFDSAACRGLPDDDKPIQLTLRLAFPELLVDVNLTIDLPVGYPVVAPSMLLRLKQSQPTVNEKSLNSAFHGWLSEAIIAGEPIICSAVDWLRSALNDNTEAYVRHAPNDSTKCGDVEVQPTQSPEICYWIFSHHIRNPKKRKVIVDWARELYLTGCCLPGKPGIVVAEGASDKVSCVFYLQSRVNICFVCMTKSLRCVLLP
uniref:RWD domain-containing protein n=1 Tax=Mesocestoides corti TaxID=53468 RepID=A0A5K3FBU6_MESCO